MEHPIFACSMAVFCVNKVGRHGVNPHAFSPKKNKTQRCKLPKYDKVHHVAMRKNYTTTGQHIWSKTPQTGLGSFWALLLATFGSARARPITLPCGRFMTTKGTTYAIGQATSNCHKQSKCFYITKQINIKVSIYTNLCVFLQHES